MQEIIYTTKPLKDKDGNTIHCSRCGEQCYLDVHGHVVTSDDCDNCEECNTAGK